jgi:hypothetical protein
MNERDRAHLLYLDAGDIDDDRLDFDGLEVLDPAGQKLGDLDGFIVHRETRRPYYAVVDSGGWFSSRRFLLPIGHARLDAGSQALRVDLVRGTIERFPDFDEERFEQMTEDEARLFNERTLTACCATELQGRTGADRDDVDTWSHYAQPAWWRSTWFTSTPAGTAARADSNAPRRDVPLTPGPGPMPARERVMARERDLADRDIDVERPDREERFESDPLDRAQPGDVLGVERGGETTSLGETARDERERLRDAEKDAAELRRDEDERENRGR